MDAFAVAIAAGLKIKHLTGRHVFRLAFCFGFFQFTMAVLGWLGGRTISGYIRTYDHWVAFGLLVAVGFKMLLEGLSGKVPPGRSDPTRGWTVIALSVATSIDALAAGLSMAFIGVSIWLPSVVIGIVAAAMTATGIRFGNRLGRKGGRWAELLGGAVLIGIGVHIILSHLLDARIQ
ncbi:MAG: manganese efflux pump MntP family protein [Planctomycetota bacterium]|nr:manganese efflux pump MntP family protein [Planctomycetota bacterium]